MSSVVVYGDVNPNVIDGSSIWLMSVSEVLSGVFDEVHIQLKIHPQNRTLLSAVDGVANIHIHAPEGIADGAALGTTAAAELVEKLLEETRSTAVVVRGFRVSYDFSLNERISPVLWSYVTDLPFPPKKMSDTNVQQMKHIAENSRRIFAQTEAARSYWEALVPQAAGRVLLIPPMIPDYAFNTEKNPKITEQVAIKIVYAGKLAREWRTLEMLELPRKLMELDIEAQLTVVGAKFNKAKDDPQWVGRMRDALEKAHADPDSGVTWLGALPRTESIKEIMKADLGFGWRTAELDSSLEVSTKALEYGAAGAAPIVNETEDHRLLWGENYPFFVRADDTIESLANKVAVGLSALPEARQKAAQASEYFSMSKARERFASYFERAGALFTSEISNGYRPRRVVVASHDLKFMGELMDFLTRNPSFDVQQDKWATLHTHNEENSKQLAEWADTVFCEWAGPSLAWYSRHIPEGTRLISRLHRFELNGPWMDHVAWDKVNKLVFVSDWVRDEAVAKFGLDISKTVVLSNTVDLGDFDRPKTRNARFTLGLVGMVPFLKRPDRALDLLEQLIRVDPRYVLRVKGRMPWDYPHVWANPVEKQLYLDFFARIANNPMLSQHVAFDGFGADVASWFRSVGFILSPSELESFHLATAEGMSSGAIPIVWERLGALGIFGASALQKSSDEGVSKILELQGDSDFAEASSEAKSYAARWDTVQVLPQWEQLLGGR